MIRAMLWLLKIGALSYLGFGALLYFGQRAMMYLPVGANPADDVAVETLVVDGAELRVWVVNPGQRRALVYFGGNAEDVYFNAADFAARLPDHTSYLVNYRGYGGSSGRPAEAALFDDAVAVFDVLRPRHDRLSAVGRSLGSGVAVYLASQRQVERLVLVTAHDSATAIARRLYPIYPVAWMLKDRYDSVRYAPGVAAPVLLLTAEHDNIVPQAHSVQLASAFEAATVEHQVIAGAGHNDIAGYMHYWSAIADFLSD